MRKSFRWHLFIHIFFATALVIYSNRIIAQLFTTQVMRDRIVHNVASTLETCQDEAGSASAFMQCAARSNRGEALSSVSEYYVLCQPKGGAKLAEQDPKCQQLTSAKLERGAPPESASDAVLMRRMALGGDDWLVFSLARAPDGVQVMVRDDDVKQYVDSIWSLRDRILIYVAPFVIAMLTVVTLFMVWVVMRPIRQLEESLTGLTSHNLDQPLGLLPSYREFDKFVAVFEQLRERLSQSFLQTRRFAADASHELKTPLTILRGNSERLIGELPTGSPAQVRMRLIGDEIERLIDITEKLLLLSRADANSIRFDMERLSLSALVTELALDAMAFNPALKIESEVESDVICTCDRNLMQQLVHNLYTNAAKYNVPDGWIRFSLARQQDGFVLSVENPCDNVPPDLPERAFQRFYRHDAARGRQVDGVGLGLSLCQEIARLHNAKLRLQVTERKTVIATLEGPLVAG